MQVRRLRTGEGALLRDVRLRALRDAPHAFASSYDREAAYGSDEWERRAASAVFVAIEDARAVGMAGGFFAGDDRDTATLWGMWVDPVARRRALGRRLVEAVAGWARESGASRLELSVTDRAAAAAALYRRLGFSPTGERRPLASDPSLTEIILARRL